MVFSKGEVPCDVLFIGEGPGKSEDVFGIPFVGPSGNLLAGVIEETLPGACIAYSNLVACLPVSETGEKGVAPAKDCIEACRDRLLEFISLSSPKVIVCVGTVATRYITKLQLDIPLVHIVYPSAILRANTAQQGIMRRQCKIALVDQVLPIIQGHNKA